MHRLFSTTRWDAARQRRWIAEEARRRDLITRDGPQPPTDRGVLTVAAIAGAALVLAALAVAVWAWIHP